MSLILPKKTEQNFSSLIVSDLTLWKLCLKLINLEIVLEATRIDPRGVGKPVHKRHKSKYYSFSWEKVQSEKSVLFSSFHQIKFLL